MAALKHRECDLRNRKTDGQKNAKSKALHVVHLKAVIPSTCFLNMKQHYGTDMTDSVVWLEHKYSPVFSIYYIKTARQVLSSLVILPSQSPPGPAFTLDNK